MSTTTRTQYCVIYLKDRKEQQTAWFSSIGRARKALTLIQHRYGEKNAIIFQD